MARDPNKEYSLQTFKQLCKDALERLPETAKDKEANYEVRRESALEQLWHEVRRYADYNRKKIGIDENPRWLWLENQIVHVVSFAWSVDSLDLRSIIREYVENAVGKQA